MPLLRGEFTARRRVYGQDEIYKPEGNSNNCCVVCIVVLCLIDSQIKIGLQKNKGNSYDAKRDC